MGAEDEDEEETFVDMAKRMTSLTDDGEVKKKLIFRGDQGQGCPPPRATVTIHYSLYLEDNDEPFDSSVLRGRPERFRLDVGSMIAGEAVHDVFLL